MTDPRVRYDTLLEAQQARRDAERAREQDIVAADQDLLAAAKVLRAVELNGHWDDPTWWDAIGNFRNIADRRAQLEEDR